MPERSCVACHMCSDKCLDSLGSYSQGSQLFLHILVVVVTVCLAATTTLRWLIVVVSCILGIHLQGNMVGEHVDVTGVVTVAGGITLLQVSCAYAQRRGCAFACAYGVHGVCLKDEVRCWVLPSVGATV
jgi:hypothetical protein